MANKYDEMAQQMRADGVDETAIARFVAEERAEDEFRRGRGTTDIEAASAWKGIPESIRQLLLGNAFCPNCGVTSFAPDYTLRMRHGRVLVEGCCAKCGAEVARLCDWCRKIFRDTDHLTSSDFLSRTNVPFVCGSRFVKY